MAVHCVKDHFRRTYFDKFMPTCLRSPVFYETQCSYSYCRAMQLHDIINLSLCSWHARQRHKLQSVLNNSVVSFYDGTNFSGLIFCVFRKTRQLIALKSVAFNHPTVEIDAFSHENPNNRMKPYIAAKLNFLENTLRRWNYRNIFIFSHICL